jgi:predicted dehydrogenase
MNAALIGLEGHQSAMLEGIAQLDDVHLVAVASDNPQKLEAMRRNRAATGDTRFYADWRELLQRHELDVVGICTVNGARAPVLLECAKRGVHILSEKPLVTTHEDLAAVRGAIERAGVRLSMLMTMRFEPAYKKMHDLIRQGAIGEPVLATAQKSYKLGDRPEWMRDRATFGGVIPFVGIHALDLIRWTTGCEFTAVAAWHGNVAHPEIRDMEDNASVLLRMGNGGTATLRVDYLRPAAAPTHGDDRLRVAGSEGILEVLGDDHRLTLVTHDQGPHVIEPDPEEQFFVDFVRSLRGECAHRISADDAYRLTDLCLKARDAADEGRTVSLASADCGCPGC